MSTAGVLRFTQEGHRYTIDGAPVPSITQLLKLAGLVDDRWYTDESRIRGTAVHDLTKDWDLKAITSLEQVESPFKGYLCGYVAMLDMLRPTMLMIEERGYHPFWHFAGTPDRDLQMFKVRGNMEIKSGVAEYSHRVQVALQAILREPACGIPAEHQGRWCVYLREDGRFKVETFDDKADIEQAKRILRRHAC